MTETAPPVSERRCRVLRIALIASVTLNLIVAGLVIGAVVAHDRRPPPDGDGLDVVGFNPFIRALPHEERAEIGKALSARAGTLRQNRDAFRAEFDRLLTLLRAEPFDMAAVRTAIEKQQARLAELQTIGRDLLFERIEAMSPTQRRAFADSLEQTLKRGPRKHGRDDDDD